MRISNNNFNFKGNISKLAKPLNAFLDKNSTIPTLLIETGVTIGRTYEAAKKGGKKEAIERFIEQGLSAVIWLRGVQGINKIIKLIAESFKKGISQTDNFKAGNMLASLALATGFIGFVLPKINHFISDKITQKSSKKDDFKEQTTIKTQTLEEFKKKNKNPSFTSLVSVANAFEKNNALRLFATDTGVIAGRYKNGRNKYERLEGLFRDIASIYFYLRATDDFVNISKKLFNIETITKEHLQELIKKPNSATNKDNKMIRTTFMLYALGTALSTYVLGILIPKAQYALRKKLTNKDEFPGDENYSTENK